MSAYASLQPWEKAAAVRKATRRQRRLKAQGLCTVCGEPQAPGCTGACEKHRAERNQRTYEYRKRRMVKDPAYREAMRAKDAEQRQREKRRNAVARQLRDAGALLALCHVFGLELPAERTSEAAVRVLRVAGQRLVEAMGRTHRGKTRPASQEAEPEQPVVCPGCFAIDEPCKPGCIDEQLRQAREERSDEGDGAE